MTDNEKATARALAGLVNPPQLSYPEGVTKTVSRLQEAGFLVAGAHVSLNEDDEPTYIELVCPAVKLLTEHSRVKALLVSWGLRSPWVYSTPVTSPDTLLGSIVINDVDDRSFEEAK